MDLPFKPGELDSELQRSFFYTAASLVVVLLFIGAHNVFTPDEPVRVGMVEVSTECYGLEAGVCLGLQRQDYRTYNYENYTAPEPGTENFYRRVESELMIRAYNTCNKTMDGMEWASRVEYRNRTAAEWAENPNVKLLPCGSTFYRELKGNP